MSRTVHGEIGGPVTASATGLTRRHGRERENKKSG